MPLVVHSDRSASSADSTSDVLDRLDALERVRESVGASGADPRQQYPDLGCDYL